MHFIEYILIALIVCGLAYSVIASMAVHIFFRDKFYVVSSELPAVSILKPLKGNDPELVSNIRSFAEQDYPSYELLLGLNNPDEAELANARTIVDSIAKDNVRLVVSNHDLGANQKVSNLYGLAQEARYDLMVMSDSDMRVERDYLKTIMSEYKNEPGNGMVTSLYKISRPSNLGSALESLTIALDFLPSVLVARQLEGVSFGLGASMLFQKAELNQIGGFRAVADFLADDYQIGNRISVKGHKIAVSRYVVENVTGPMSLVEHFSHQLRWAKTIRASRPAGFAGSGITHTLPYALMLICIKGPDPLSLALLMLALLFGYIKAYVVLNSVIKSATWLKWLLLLPAKDVLSFVIWIRAFFGNTVIWRGHRLRLNKTGVIQRI